MQQILGNMTSYDQRSCITSVFTMAGNISHIKWMHACVISTTTSENSL